jgi:hypothetical protein
MNVLVAFMKVNGSVDSVTGREKSSSQMVPSMKGSGSLDEPLVMASLLPKKAKSTKASGSMTRGTASGYQYIRMEELSKACGDVTSSTALESRNGKMVPGSQETTAKERNLALVITCGATVRHTRAVGKIIKWQGSVVTHGPTKNSAL